MNVRGRIAAIRLSEKISKNPEYAEQIGVYVVNGIPETIQYELCKDREKIFLKKEGKEYDNKSRGIPETENG